MAPLLAIAALGFAVASRAPVASARHRVELSAIAYHPDTLQVTVGDTIVWINQDLVPHTATASGEWDTGSIPPGDSARFIPRHKGKWSYACSFHPTMKASLTVR